MPTVRQTVSDINASLKAMNINDWISPRAIYSRLQAVTSDFLAKANNSTRLISKNDALFTEIEGLPMISVPVTECEFDSYMCQKLMKSKERLPDIYSGKFGKIINQVASINFGMIYQNANTPRQWKAIQKREFKNPDIKYYFFLNGFLYIPILKASEESPEEIRISAAFRDRFQVFKFKQKLGTCEECKKDNPCPKLLDFQIVMPDFLEDDIKSKVVLDLANVYLKVVPSEYPNLNPNDKNNERDIQNRKLTDS